MKTTVYSFAKRLMADDEFNRGGIIENEQRYLDAIGFDYEKDANGTICASGADLAEFYQTMEVIRCLHKKYDIKF